MEIRIRVSEFGVEYTPVRRMQKGKRVAFTRESILKEHGSSLTDADVKALCGERYNKSWGDKTINGNQ